MSKNKWFLNGGRGSGKSIRLLCEAYETKIADLKEEINKIAFARGNLEEENAELKNVIRLLIATLNDTTWDEGHPGYSDSEPHYNCPNCGCEDCYRVSCKFNESELFKKLYKEFPELYKDSEVEK